MPQADTAARLVLLRDIGAIYKTRSRATRRSSPCSRRSWRLIPSDLRATRELARVLRRARPLAGLCSRRSPASRSSRPIRGPRSSSIARSRAGGSISSRTSRTRSSPTRSSRELAPDDAEAIAKLRELYTKRRAFKSLYDLLDRMAQRMEPGLRGASVWLEMAKIAAERLDRGGDAAASTGSSSRKIRPQPARSTRSRSRPSATRTTEPSPRFSSAACRRAGRRARSSDSPEAGGRLHRPPPRRRRGEECLAARARSSSRANPKALRVLRDSFVAQGDYDGLTELYETPGRFRGARRGPLLRGRQG